MKTAKYLGVPEDFRGDARAYELDPPLTYDDGRHSTSLVIVSAAYVPYSGPETYIFAAKRVGDVVDVADWMELPGSFRGGLDHEAALENAGYEVVIG